MTTEGIEVKSVGNTLVLHETALIEAFNLKAAIEYQLKKCEYKQQTTPLPPFIPKEMNTITTVLEFSIAIHRINDLRNKFVPQPFPRHC